MIKMDSNQKNNFQDNAPSLIDLLNILRKYYLVIVFSIIISISFSIYLISLTNKVEFTSSGVIENSSYLNMDKVLGEPTRQYYKHKGYKNEDPLFFIFANQHPDIKFSATLVDDKSLIIEAKSYFSQEKSTNGLIKFKDNLYSLQKQSIQDRSRQKKAKIDNVNASLHKILNIYKPHYEEIFSSMKEAISNLEVMSDTLKFDGNISMERITLETELKKLRIQLIEYERDWALMNVDKSIDNPTSFQKLLNLKETLEFSLDESHWKPLNFIGEISENSKEVKMNNALIILLATFFGFGFGSLFAFILNFLTLRSNR
jgi:hypothetical protein